jgi:diguanylate cyclase (GGDEF)-like protein
MSSVSIMRVRACGERDLQRMSDSQPNPPIPSGEPEAGANDPDTPPVAEPSPDPAPEQSSAPSPIGVPAVRPGAASARRPALLASAAVLCVLVAGAGTWFAARSIARNDAAGARKAFPQASTAIASALKLAVQRQEELTVSASTYFAHNPQTSPAEFHTWMKWARTARRFPELENLGLLTLVRAGELSAFQARVSGRAVKAPAPRSTGSRSASAHPAASAAAGPKLASTSAAAGAKVVPASDHHYYCLTIAELARSAAVAAPAGMDYCARTPALLLARDTGVSSYTSVSADGAEALEIAVPVYRGNVTPRSVLGRGLASLGWLREVLVPGVMLQQALRGHAGDGVSLSYQTGASAVTFASGAPQAGSQVATTSLHDGWSVTSFAAPVSANVLEDGDALALLIAGGALSLLLGLLVLLLGAGRAEGSAPPVGPREAPDSDLYDGLTGLPNRALTLDRAECMVARASRQSGMLAGALFIDIDWLKDVNDKLGQAAGDQLLQIAAQRLQNVVRTGDTVGHLGGDEFVVLVESAARGVRLDSLARRVIESLHKPVELEGFGPSFFFTASIGVAFGRYETHEDLLRDAQLALDAAKAAGKDRYTLFNANMRSVIESRGVLEDELNSALQDKQLFLLYQPIYDLGTRRVVGLEALVRWMHPKRGILPPADFIPLAEETGLVVPIGRWALEEACLRAAAWNVAGHDVGVSVKVSANQLNRDGFLTDVRRALQQSGIAPAMLTLEVAETTVIRDVAAAAERMQEIKRLGVRIAVDDFGGSGYARHSDLRRLPLDFLKVDRNSLAASDDEAYRNWLIEAILIVGRELSLTVIATGIETSEQIAALQGMGCTMAQGSFAGDPMPLDAVAGLFDSELPATAAATSALAPSPSSSSPADLWQPER